MPRAIDLMRRREQEILTALKYLSEKTDGFTNPKIVMIGGYALRAFIKFSRFTRDCDFILKKKDGWHLDAVKGLLPEGYGIQEFRRLDSYGFMRAFRLVKHDKARIRISLDFMEGEIRGRTERDIIVIDDKMVQNSIVVSIEVAGHEIKIYVPNYTDYFIMKVVSARASDVRDTASLIHENSSPRGLKERVSEVLPDPEVFTSKLKERIIPEIRRRTFIDSWRGIFATIEYNDNDKKEVLEKLGNLRKEFR